MSQFASETPRSIVCISTTRGFLDETNQDLAAPEYLDVVATQEPKEDHPVLLEPPKEPLVILAEEKRITRYPAWLPLKIMGQQLWKGGKT